MHKLSIPLRLAWRELRHGWKHFVILMACLTLGVAVMASVNSLGAMVERALEGEAQSLLGGDIETRLRGVEPTAEQRDYLESYGRLSYVADMRTMLYATDDSGMSTLVEIKAVDAAYPLIGDLLFHEDISKDEALADGGIAVDPILLSQLGLQVGDEVRLGNATYTIRATIKREPDRVVQIFNFGPRVLLSHESLRDSGLINTFSLIYHRYRIMVPDGVVANEAYEEQMEQALGARYPDQSWRVRTGNDGNRSIERFMDQLLSFLTLSGLATFLIAGVGIGSSSRAYLEKKLQTIAVFKVLGAARKTVLQTYIAVLGILALAGSVVGIAIAVVTMLALLPLVASVLPVVEQYQSIQILPLLLAMWYGILITFLFSVPALLSALEIRPSLLFRSKGSVLLFRFDSTVRKVVALLVVLLLATLVVNAQDKAFILGAIGVLILAFTLFGLCTEWVRRRARKVKVKSPWLRLAVGNLYRPGSTAGTVVFAIGISLTVLITLTLTEANFQSRIQEIAEEDAPSLFMLDIQPHQKEGLDALIAEYTSQEERMLYPMVRGRISQIKGVPADQVAVDDDVDWAVRGDRGLSYSAIPPNNANIVLGEWWPEDYDGPPQVSVDDRFIAGMDLALGDTLTLNVLGEEITAMVTSARDIDYATMQINFAMMLSPGVIEEYPHTALATVHLDASDDEAELVRRIGQEFPGVTVVRTTEVVALVRDVIGHIATALRVTVAISLLAGLLVLASALSATLEQRMYDTAVLKVLGARKSDILKSCTAEWMLLALATAVIAASIGTFGAWLVVERFPGQDFTVMPEVTLSTIAVCIVVVWVTGFIGNRRLFKMRPAALLRNE